MILMWSKAVLLTTSIPVPMSHVSDDETRADYEEVVNPADAEG